MHGAPFCHGELCCSARWSLHEWRVWKQRRRAENDRFERGAELEDERHDLGEGEGDLAVQLSAEVVLPGETAEPAGQLRRGVRRELGAQRHCHSVLEVRHRQPRPLGRRHRPPGGVSADPELARCPKVAGGPESGGHPPSLAPQPG